MRASGGLYRFSCPQALSDVFETRGRPSPAGGREPSDSEPSLGAGSKRQYLKQRATPAAITSDQGIRIK